MFFLSLASCFSQQEALRESSKNLYCAKMSMFTVVGERVYMGELAITKLSYMLIFVVGEKRL